MEECCWWAQSHQFDALCFLLFVTYTLTTSLILRNLPFLELGYEQKNETPDCL